MLRRQFFRQSAAAAASLGVFPAALSAIGREQAPGQIERRSLGKTGEKLAVVAFGGFCLNTATPEQAEALVKQAVELGVNHFDVAPEYGKSEERMGPALEPFRKQCFLSCKTAQRRRDAAEAELERSLRRLRTDHFDLYQLHHVSKPEEVEAIFAPDGAIHALEAARRDGRVRFLGFSAHSVEAALALMDRFDFDSIMFPVNYATWHAGEFGPQVLAKAHEKGLGILALKAMCKRPWPKGADRSKFPTCWYEPFSDPEEALMGLRFTLSHPVTTCMLPASMPCHELAFRIAHRVTPLEPSEVESIKQKALATAPLFRHHPEDGPSRG